MNKNESDYKLSLEETGLSKRLPSWILFGVIALAFLVIPMISLLSDDVSDTLRNSPLPSDNSWITGKLSQPHQIPDLNQNCQACHVNAFEMVQDESCLSCHSDVNHHFDTTVHDVEKLDGARCASCHREHSEPVEIVRKDDQLCTSCHEDMSSSGAVQTELADVDGFGKEQKLGSLKAPHPSFNISMMVPTGSADETSWNLERVKLADAPLEKSNLVFPHDTHLDPAGIDAPEGQRVLECADCHTPDAAGELMQPVRMETNCRSCHTMVFDEAAPDREVPHGDPDTVLLTLEEYYSRQFLRNSLGRAPTPQEVQDFMLRRPGKNVQRRDEQTLNMASPWGKANSVAQEIFEKTTCKTCHVISISDDPKHLSKWRVDPIRLTEQWMPKSRFDHISHRTSDCGVCHSATTSSEASDVLMPDLAVCEACHTGSKTHESKVPSSCESCHDFHLDGQHAWSTQAALSD